MTCLHVNNERTAKGERSRWCLDCGAVFRAGAILWTLPRSAAPARPEAESLPAMSSAAMAVPVYNCETGVCGICWNCTRTGNAAPSEPAGNPGHARVATSANSAADT